MVNIIENPLVSVVMSTYNDNPDFLEHAISSIANQTYRNLELLIVDDSTVAESKAVIDHWKCRDPRIRLMRFPDKKGFVASLNEGLRIASGEFIARMDGDDISEPERIEKEVAYLIGHPDISVVGTTMYIINEHGDVISFRNYLTGYKKLRKMSCFKSPLAHPSVMMRRKIIDTGFFYDDKFKKAEDYELWLRLMKSGYKMDNINEPLLRYRISFNMADKRHGEHFLYVLRAKIKNFDWRHPFFSSFSLLISGVVYITPLFIFRKIYQSALGTH
jgi:glycosyltransferase involved in cell wall biosynthesis